jgi:hypothetical protein
MSKKSIRLYLTVYITIGTLGFVAGLILAGVRP